MGDSSGHENHRRDISYERAVYLFFRVIYKKLASTPVQLIRCGPELSNSTDESRRSECLL